MGVRAKALGRRKPSARPLAVPQPPVRGQLVRSEDGTELHVEVYGPTGTALATAVPGEVPTLVLVHGWTCALRFWQHQIHELARSFRVVAFDLRGHGKSTPARGGDYSPAAFAADIQAVLEGVLAPGQRAVLAGHSLGAMSVAAWARRYPAEVPRRAAAIAMLSTGLGDLVGEAAIVRVAKQLSAVRKPIGARLLGLATPVPRRAVPALRRAVRYVALSPDATPEQVALCEEMFRACSGAVRGACGTQLARLDLHDATASFAAPTLVLVGARDKLTPPSHARRLAESLPQLTELVELPLVGHMTPIEAPGEVCAHLRKLVLAHLLAPAPAPRVGDPHVGVVEV